MNTQNQILNDDQLDSVTGGNAIVRWVVSRVAAKGIIAVGDAAIKKGKEVYREIVQGAARALPRPPGL